jgi:hypothetical protein
MKVFTQAMTWALATSVELALLGCQHDSGAAGAYHMGRLEATLDASPQTVVNASKAALSDLHFAEVSSRQEGLDGRVMAKTADDRKIEVRIDGQSDKVSKVVIAVGILGDESLSRQVLDKIRSNLPLIDRTTSAY